LEDAPFLGPLREGKNFFIQGNFYEEFERYVKKGLVYGQLHRGPVGEPGGGLLTGTFQRKRDCISGFLFLGPRGH